MVGMAVSRELYKENAVAYVSTSNTAILAVKSFHNRPNSMSNKRHENKCKNCGRTHVIGKYTARNTPCNKCKKRHFAKYCHKNKRQFYHQLCSFSGPNKTSAQQSNHNMRPVVKVYMVNKQGDYEEDTQWDGVESRIGPINYTDSVDLVYNPHYEHPQDLL